MSDKSTIGPPLNCMRRPAAASDGVSPEEEEEGRPALMARSEAYNAGATTAARFRDARGTPQPGRDAKGLFGGPPITWWQRAASDLSCLFLALTGSGLFVVV